MKVLLFTHEQDIDGMGNIILAKQASTNLDYYEYLTTNNLLSPTPVLDELVEFTRQHDTWEWKKKFNNNENARNLYILYEKLGYKIILKQLLKL